jgi:hypothetical protein
MNKSELKALLISKIPEIRKISVLQGMKDLLDTSSENDVMKLTSVQVSEIEVSKSDMEQGLYTENKLFVKEVKQWLKGR